MLTFVWPNSRNDATVYWFLMFQHTLVVPGHKPFKSKTSSLKMERVFSVLK